MLWIGNLRLEFNRAKLVEELEKLPGDLKLSWCPNCVAVTGTLNQREFDMDQEFDMNQKFEAGIHLIWVEMWKCGKVEETLWGFKEEVVSQVCHWNPEPEGI